MSATPGVITERAHAMDEPGFKRAVFASFAVFGALAVPRFD